MNTVKELQARRVLLVKDRAECAHLGLATDGVDMAITSIDRQLQNLLGYGDDEEDSEPAVFPWGNVFLMVGGVVLLCWAIALALEWMP